MANKSFVVQYLIKARENFSEAAKKTRAASERMRESISKTKAKFNAFSADFVKQSRKIRNAGAVLTLAVTTPILLMANSLKNAARDAQETRSKFQTVFKDVAASSQSTADTFAKNFGLAGTTARALLGDTGDLLSGFGFTGQAALDLSTKVNELAVDLASFTNFSGGAEGASAALTKALLGERESLKSLGVAILETDVKARILKMLSEGQTFTSLRQAKAYATLSLATEQSKNAIGDYARTSKDLANQERETSSRIQDLKEAFGAILMPVALKLTQVIRGLATRLTALSPHTKKIVLIVAALLAVLGPLLVVVGSIGLALPFLATGFAAVGTAMTFALGPIGLIAIGIAAAAFLILRNWAQVKAFFVNMWNSIRTVAGPAIGQLVGRFMEVGKAIRTAIGPAFDVLVGKIQLATDKVFSLIDGLAKSSAGFLDLGNIGQLVGDIVGGTLDVIIRGLSGMGAILGQLVAAATTLDFSQLDIAAIKAEFAGSGAATASRQQIDVGFNIGLAEGLEQTSSANVAGSGVRRLDVGALR